MKKSFACILFVLLCSLGYSQNKGSINGLIVDESGKGLALSTVVLLNATDSVLVTYALTDDTGMYTLKQVPFGSYLVQASFVGLKTNSVAAELTKAEPDLNVDNIVLKADAVDLAKVKIEAEVPIMIKGDTLEYNADSFNTDENDNVEKLLKQLPGVEVDKDGNVKAQGEEINKILVDGKEFFGDDPKMATQNLPADAVDKVQVYNKKSDFAEYTGVDDGSREKTINLQLKEDKKKGAFGEVRGGYGTDQFTDNKLSLNRFNKNKQISVLGQYNNVNRVGFSLEDYFSFGGGMGDIFSGGMLELSADDMPVPLDFGDDLGLTKTASLGLNYNWEFSDRSDLQSSFFFNQQKKDIESLANRQFLGVDNQYLSNQMADENSSNNNYRMDLRFEQELDTSSRVLIRANGRLNDFNDSEISTLSNTSLLGDLLNDARVNRNSKSNYWSGSLSGSYFKKFNKPGRAATAGLNYKTNENDRTSFVDNTNRFTVGEDLIEDAFKQRQERLNELTEWGMTASYIEPITLNSYVEFNGGYSVSGKDLGKDFFDQIGQDGEESFNSDLSLDYTNGLEKLSSGAELHIRSDKAHLSLGGSYESVDFSGSVGDSVQVNKNFSQFLPQLFYSYDFSNTNRLMLFGNTRQRIPTIQELQPILDNSNPLSLYQGNPDLEAETTYSLQASYYFYSRFSYVGFNVRLGGDYTDNKIASAVSLDPNFVQLIRPINTDYSINTFASFGLDAPIRPLKVKYSFGPEFSASRGFVSVNDVVDQSDRQNAGGYFELENRFKEKLDWVIGVYGNYSRTSYDQQTALNQDYWLTEYFAELQLDLGERWNFETACTYELYSGERLDNTSIVLLEAALSRDFLDSKRLQLELSAYDILNQRQGVFRTSNINYIEEKFANTLTQYFMFSAKWRLSKFERNQGIVFKGE